MSKVILQLSFFRLQVFVFVRWLPSCLLSQRKLQARILAEEMRLIASCHPVSEWALDSGGSPASSSLNVRYTRQKNLRSIAQRGTHRRTAVLPDWIPFVEVQIQPHASRVPSANVPQTFCKSFQFKENICF